MHSTQVHGFFSYLLVNEGEIREIRFPFDESGEFISTEYSWIKPVIVLTLWYKCR